MSEQYRVNFNGLGCEGVDWIYMAQRREQWRSLLILQINLQSSMKGEDSRKTHEDEVIVEDNPDVRTTDWRNILGLIKRVQQHTSAKFLVSFQIQQIYCSFFFSNLVITHYRNKPCVIQAHSVYVNSKMAHNVYIKFIPLVNILTLSIIGLIFFISLHKSTNCNKNIISRKAVGGTSVQSRYFCLQNSLQGTIIFYVTAISLDTNLSQSPT